MMKNIRKSIILVLILSMFMSTIPFMTNKSYAEEARTSIVKGSNASRYVFNANDVLVWAARVGSGDDNSTTMEYWPFITTKITKEKIGSKDFIELSSEDSCSDNSLNVVDAADILIAQFKGEDSFSIIKDLAKALSINENDIVLKTTIAMPDINQNFIYEIKQGKLVQSDNDIKTNNKKLFEYTKHCYLSGEYKSLEDSYSIKGGSKDEWNEIIEFTREMLAAKGNSSENVSDEELQMNIMKEQKFNYATISVDAILPDGTIYKLVIGGNDKWQRNWLLEKVETQKPKTEFSTTMEYDSKTEDNTKGKMSEDGKTYLPPYYDDDNNKKDADVIVTIKSTTDETIVETNGVALTDSNTKGNPNSEGWYYPDINNKKVIEKEYPFDKYDNTTYNGIINEEVNLTGGEGGKSSQNPSIKWTFRRKIKEQSENSDGSTTVTITYNLPVDESSIPDGWSPVYDNDGKTIHKITRTFKKGEKYDKDVTVKQNGTGIPNTTHVTIKPKVLPATGQSTTLISVIFVIAVVAITRYLKVKNKV